MTKVNKYPEYSTKLFVDIYGDVESFKKDYMECGIPTTITEASVTTLYYLLYAKYGNTPIANYDTTQFSYKLFSTIFMYGPAWEKRLDIQNKLRTLTDEELVTGSKAIYNHAFNPSSEPATTGELNFINEQNTTSHNKSKMDAYGMLWDLLSTDVTSEFINRFENLFKKFVRPAHTWIYETDIEEDND